MYRQIYTIYLKNKLSNQKKSLFVDVFLIKIIYIAEY